MRTVTILAVALATLSSIPLIARQQQQQPDPNAQQQSSPSTAPGAQAPATQPSQSTSPSQAATQSAAPLLEMSPVNGELEGKLDSKSAKTGDSVVVKTKEEVKTSDGTVIPKGSRLMGHVTVVQARGEGKENSQLAIQFDQAEVQGGQKVAILSVIQSVSPAGGGSANSPGMTGNPIPTAPGGGMAGSSSASGGGSMGSSASASRPSGGEMTGSSTPSTSQPSSSANSASPASGAQGGAPVAGTIVSQKGNIAIRTTAIPGVLVANNINGQPFSNASGLLLGASRDIHLDSGTQMALTVTSAPGARPGGN